MSWNQYSNIAKAPIDLLLDRYPTNQMQVNGVTISDETQIATRRHFARIKLAAASEYYGPGKQGERLGKSKAQMAEYRARDWESLKAGLRGEGDHTITFMQRALFIQTGDCPSVF